MPLPMAHLAVAVRIQNLVDRNSFPNFLLGSIAPDAIHMRPGSGPDDKQRGHLSESDVLLYERARLLCVQNRSDRAGFAEG